MGFVGTIGLISAVCGAAVILDGKRMWTGVALATFGFSLLMWYAASA